MSVSIPAERIELRILVMRAQRVMLDADLATLYGVPTKALNRAVKRNRERFPGDFMFRLTKEEAKHLRRQNGTSSTPPPRAVAGSWGGRRYLPYVFTEQGVAMLSSVLRSRRAILVNVEIMRAFVRLRTLAWSVAELRQRIDGLERKYDVQFKVVFDAIRELMAPPLPGEKRRIGFRPEASGAPRSLPSPRTP
jgi:ORF6N domain